MTRILQACALSLLLVLSACGKPAADPGESGHPEGEESHGTEGHQDADRHEKSGQSEQGHTEEDHEANRTEEGHGEEGQSGALKLTAEARRNANLSIAPAGPATLQDNLPLYGITKLNAESVRSVTARFPGVVRSVAARIGDAVREGATLATVESDESLQEYAVRSPLSGVVTERLTNPGQQAGSEPLFTVADLSTVWVELTFFSRDRSRIREGQSVRVRATDGGHASEGKIVFVSPLGAATTQSLTARVLLDNRDGRWTPGLHVRGAVAVGQAAVALAVPAAAIQEIEGVAAVFVDGPKGLEARPVKLGRNDGQLVEILSGLSAGEAVVGEGSFVLKAELGKGEAEHAH